MRPLKFSALFLFVIGTVLVSNNSWCQNSQNKEHIMVALRMIGHQVLLNAGDSTSLVLPVIEEDGRYRIQFESDFNFSPDELVATIFRIASETALADSYILEVEDCKDEAVIYSFEINDSSQLNVVPCLTRSQPKSCYNLLFTIIDDEISNPYDKVSFSMVYSNGANNESELIIAIVLLALGLAALLIVVLKRRNNSASDPNLITLGKFQFDKRNTTLLIEDQKLVLTNIEAELLILLYNEVNNTIEREIILNVVWGDQGDYIGRTLDVFISKLRKKLEADLSVKIVNIRGVGYKLVIDQ